MHLEPRFYPFHKIVYNFYISDQMVVVHAICHPFSYSPIYLILPYFDRFIDLYTYLLAVVIKKTKFLCLNKLFHALFGGNLQRTNKLISQAFIMKALEPDRDVTSIEVDIGLSTLKLQHVKVMTELYDYLKTEHGRKIKYHLNS